MRASFGHRVQDGLTVRSAWRQAAHEHPRLPVPVSGLIGMRLYGTATTWMPTSASLVGLIAAVCLLTLATSVDGSWRLEKADHSQTLSCRTGIASDVLSGGGPKAVHGTHSRHRLTASRTTAGRCHSNTRGRERERSSTSLVGDLTACLLTYSAEHEHSIGIARRRKFLVPLKTA